MKKNLYTCVQYLKGIGPKRAKTLAGMGINTVEDLLYYFPRRYEDRRNLSLISKLKEKEVVTVQAEVLAKGTRQSFRRRGFNIVEVAVADKTGKIFCVWFNQPYLKDYFKVGQKLILHGKVQRYANRLQMNSPEFEVIVEKEVNQATDTGKIVPIYSLPEGVTQRYFRHIIKYLLDEYLASISDFLPYDIRARNTLLNLAKSLLNIHFPQNLNLQQEAYRRLSYEEFFLFQIPLVLRKLRKKNKKGVSHKVEDGLLNGFITGLPFKLTSSQQKVVDEIRLDLIKPQPMQRLLQGDVGSGKTIIATIASFIVMQGGRQVAFMVPTEILAKQHYQKICSQFTVHSSQLKRVNIGLLTSSASKKEKDIIYKEIKEGKINLVIGTHALLEGVVEFQNLGLVVIDEQHKFGVGQRALLPKKGNNPDVLIMTATPIPRTLAITIYGDLDISVITELPPGRLPVKTMLFSQQDRLKVYNIAKEQLKLKKQVYIVYPVIDESYSLDIEGAKKMYEALKEREFKEFNVGLIHGRMKQNEQDSVMLEFQKRRIDMLIATTVLEVGIDIPTATCMIIENAERFGLSQLHQLRGRVGRGGDQSFCLLVSSAQSTESNARLAAMAKHNDGFRIAEEDLKIRGPGEFFGRRQHGLTELKIANPLTQMQLLKRAREEAIRLLDCDPHLELRQNQLLRQELLQRFPEYEKLILVG